MNILRKNCAPSWLYLQAYESVFHRLSYLSRGTKNKAFLNLLFNCRLLFTNYLFIFENYIFYKMLKTVKTVRKKLGELNT
jgi:hypothetical protein